MAGTAAGEEVGFEEDAIARFNDRTHATEGGKQLIKGRGQGRSVVGIGAKEANDRHGWDGGNVV
jgi:hypothetical protein